LAQLRPSGERLAVPLWASSCYRTRLVNALAAPRFATRAYRGSRSIDTRGEATRWGKSPTNPRRAAPHPLRGL